MYTLVICTMGRGLVMHTVRRDWSYSEKGLVMLTVETGYTVRREWPFIDWGFIDFLAAGGTEYSRYYYFSP